MSVAALVFDFNGTLSDDEPVLCEIFMHMFAEHGRPMSAQEYFDHLAGLSDPEIVKTWLGDEHPDVEAVIEERGRRYRAAAADGSTIHEHVREAVRFAAGHVPLAICSGAARTEIEPVVEAAGIADCFSTLVSSDDVVHGKPHPEGYVKTLEILDADPARAAVLEDTEAGVAAAKSAGLRCVAVAGTLPRERLARADEIVDTIDVPLVARLLG